MPVDPSEIKPSARQYPLELRAEALELYAQTGIACRVAERLGISLMTLWRWRQQDPEYDAKWRLADAMANRQLKDRVMETAIFMGLGNWVQARCEITDLPLYDDDGDPIMTFTTFGVDKHVLMKLMDKTMADEGDGGMTAIQVDTGNGDRVRIVTKSKKGTLSDADFGDG